MNHHLLYGYRQTTCLLSANWRRPKNVLMTSTIAAPSPSSSELIVLDGSKGEGGGQILRNAAALAVILGRDIRIINIRAKRDRPGLRSQHLLGLKLLSEACYGSLEGGSVGSTDITFRAAHTTSAPAANQHPKESANSSVLRELVGDAQTAGSICLLLQAIIPLALYGDQNIKWILKGGTNASMAPQYDYWEHVFMPILRKTWKIPKDNMEAKVIRRGFYPKGGGEIHVWTKPSNDSTSIVEQPLSPIQLTERGKITHVWIRSFYAGNCPKYVAGQMAKAAEDHIQREIRNNVAITTTIVHDDPAVASGSGILIVAETSTGCLLGGSALGKPKKKPRLVGIEAASELCATIQDGGCVDEYLQDQLILYMALAGGTSEILTGSLTMHTQSAISTAEQVLQKQIFEVTRLDGDNPPEKDNNGDDRISGRHLIRCKGIGFHRKTS